MEEESILWFKQFSFLRKKIKHNNVGKKSVIFMAEFMRLAKVSFKMVC